MREQWSQIINNGGMHDASNDHAIIRASFFADSEKDF